MSRLAIFIDGGYLDKIAEELNTHIDYFKISDEILKIVSKTSKDIELFRTYYYHCLPYQPPHPTPIDASRFSKKQSFFEMLNRLPCFTVRKGRLVYRGNVNGKPIFQQKRVDLLLGLDIALLSGKKK